MTKREVVNEASPRWALAESSEVVRVMESNADSGLTSAEVSARRESAGLNRLDATAARPAWRKFLAQFADPLIYLLLGAVAVSFVAWIVDGAGGTPVEVVVIVAIILGNAVLGFLQERQAERAVAALRQMAAPSAHVIRDGKKTTIPADAIVPGDILVLTEGDAVPADGRVIASASLTIAEAPLTGESEPVLKHPAVLRGEVPLADRDNMVFSGTAVTRGHGRAVVTAIGMQTEIGRIAEMLGRTKEERTPLQREIQLVGRVLGIAVLVIAVVVVGAILLTSDVDGARGIVDVLLLGVSLAVAAVPEGLPAILTVILAIGVKRMASERAIVKRLSSVETLGSASVIGTDKTGTLTKNEMTIQRVVTQSGDVTIEGIGYQPVGSVSSDGEPLLQGPLFDEVRVVLGGGSLANDAALSDETGEWKIQGDPTEAAFLVAARKLGITEASEERFDRRGEIPFSSERKLMSTFEADRARDGSIALVTKGAPGIVLERCTRVRVGAGEEPLTDEHRARILSSIGDLADAALRTLAVAYRRLDTTEPPAADESLERGLTFGGVVGMLDPPRPEAVAAIAEAKLAGLRVIMITGDHPRTAARIAADLGITNPETSSEATISGTELETMDDETLRDRSRAAVVYARVAPEHKLRIINALKAADIGVAMGITGTDVAKEAANMILADDNFATIVSAVREGRSIFANIRRGLRYLLSSNIGEVLTVFLGVIGASILGLESESGDFVFPLLATQILWINLLTDSAPALALGFDPPPSNVMQHPPRRLSDRVIDREMQLGLLFVGVVMALATLFAIDHQLPGGLIEGSASLDEARTVGFTVLVLAQLFNAFNSRSERDSAFRGLFTNSRLFAAVALSLVLQVLVVHVPFLNRAFDTVPLSVSDWLTCLVIASSVLWIDELKKLVIRMVMRRRPSPIQRSSEPRGAFDSHSPIRCRTSS